MIRILIADDHPIVRNGLKQLLSKEPGFGVPAEAATSSEVLDLVRSRPWDVVILDLSMPGRGGFEVLQEIRRERPNLPVLVLSMHPETQFAPRVLKAGAAGYLNKGSAPEELVGAVRTALQGRKYVTPALAEKLALDLAAGREGVPHERLSDREFQVICMIASGKSVSEIADEMALSVKTISTYRGRALEKMGMKTNAELTRYAIRNQLVP